ncbi:MAG: cytochrome oxidase subunit III [Alphaproteobacteria bacterium]
MSDNQINFIGWILFIVSAIGFLVSSLKSGDPWAIMGSAFFLIACLVFLIPFFRKS